MQKNPNFDSAKLRGTLGTDATTTTQYRDMRAKIDDKQSRLNYASNSKSKHFNMSGPRMSTFFLNFFSDS